MEKEKILNVTKPLTNLYRSDLKATVQIYFKTRRQSEYLHDEYTPTRYSPSVRRIIVLVELLR